MPPTTAAKPTMRGDCLSPGVGVGVGDGVGAVDTRCGKQWDTRQWRRHSMSRWPLDGDVAKSRSRT